MLIGKSKFVLKFYGHRKKRCRSQYPSTPLQLQHKCVEIFVGLQFFNSISPQSGKKSSMGVRNLIETKMTDRQNLQAK